MPLPRERLIERRNTLIASGHTDWRISCIIAKELRMNPKAVEARLAKLRKDGVIGENPNKQAKRGTGFDLAGFRTKLMEEGLCDGAIAREAAAKSGRSVNSLKTRISQLVREGKMPENENNQKAAEAEEFRWLIRRCGELASLGLTRHSMSHVLACESGRSPEALRRMIWGLEKDGLGSDATPNGRKSAEMQTIITERARLMKQGMDDAEIAKGLAKSMGRRPETIKLLIYRAVHDGGCPKNPN